MAEESFHLIAQDGTQLKGTIWKAKREPRAALLWLHGFAEHRLRYAHFGQFMADHGIDFAAIDLRGHGDSDGRRGFIREFNDYILDARVFANWLRKNYPESPVFFGGHSNGALVAARFYQLEPGIAAQFRGLILTGPFLDVAAPVPAWKQSLAKVLGKILPGISVPSGIKPEHLSHDPTIVQSYRSDARVFRNASARWYTETVRNQAAALASASEIRSPVIVLQGMDDRIVSAATSRRFYDSAGSSDRKWIGYEGLFHEILNEIDRVRVYNDILAWVKKRC